MLWTSVKEQKILNNEVDYRCCFSNPTLSPAALWVNKSSREEALRYYEKGFNNPEDDYPGIYINYDIDTALCVKETFGIGGSYTGSMEHTYDTQSALTAFSEQTRKNLKFLAIGPGLSWGYDTDIFPALKKLTTIEGALEAIDYDIVTDYRIFLAYNEQFPEHTNQRFKKPFRRYLDK